MLCRDTVVIQKFFGLAGAWHLAHTQVGEAGLDLWRRRKRGENRIAQSALRPVILHDYQMTGFLSGF